MSVTSRAISIASSSRLCASGKTSSRLVGTVMGHASWNYRASDDQEISRDPPLSRS
jgi:hypothetical protein